ncbi:MAG: response regulator transcription factor [Wenzhouxiangellaceae bacterium]
MQAILIADDHPLFRSALSGTLQRLYPQARILEAEDMPGACAMLEQHPELELVLLDLHMPGSYGFGGLMSLRNTFPTVATVMISANENPQTVQSALDFGAQGYILKRATPDQITAALAAVAEGIIWVPAEIACQLDRKQHVPSPMAAKLATLTPQQHRVLELVSEGLLNKQIADRLNIQERTIKAHVSAIFEKLEVRNRTQAGVALRELAVPDPDQAVPQHQQ